MEEKKNVKVGAWHASKNVQKAGVIDFTLPATMTSAELRVNCAYGFLCLRVISNCIIIIIINFLSFSQSE